MDLDMDSAAGRGLRRYVDLVARAVGVGSEAAIVQWDEPQCVYVALDRRAARYPDHDLALLWEELFGWGLALERPGDARLTPLGHLVGVGRLPDPEVVADYVAKAYAHGEFGASTPVPADTEDLADRLAAIAGRATTAWGLISGRAAR